MAHDGTTLRSQTAVVIEDDDATRFMILRALRSLHLSGIGLSSAEAAMAWIEINGAPALATVDVCLPRMTGLGFCRWLRGRVDTRSLPVIVVTARADAADVHTASELGAHFMPKPIRIAAFLELARSLVALEPHQRLVDSTASEGNR